MYVSFLERSAVRGDEPDAETAAAREEELEALEAIFSDDFQRDRGVSGSTEALPGDIYLAFEMRGSYPAAGGALRLTSCPMRCRSPSCRSARPGRSRARRRRP